MFKCKDEVYEMVKKNLFKQMQLLIPLFVCFFMRAVYILPYTVATSVTSPAILIHLFI